MAGKNIGLLFSVAGGGSIAGESGKAILADIKSIVSQIENSGNTKLKFGVDTSGLSSQIKARSKEIDSASKYWQGRFKDSVKDLTAPNLNLKSLNNQYKQAEQYSNSFLQKNLNGIDYEIKARELAGKQFSSQLQTQMQAEQDAANAKIKSKSILEKADAKAISDATHYNNVLAQLRAEYEKYSRAIQKNPELNTQYKSLESALSTNSYNGSVMKARNELADLDKQLFESGGKVQTLTDKFRNLFNQHLATGLTMVGIHLLYKAIGDVYNNVVELDSALVDLQIATGYTRDQTRELVAQYSQMAKELGATTVEVANSADTWLRMGYNLEDTNTLIRDSMMLSKLGQMESSESATALTSAIKGYKLSVSEAIQVVDKFSAVDMKSAVTSGFLATSMSETANSARLAGVEINKLTGYLAATGEVKYCLVA